MVGNGFFGWGAVDMSQDFQIVDGEKVKNFSTCLWTLSKLEIFLITQMMKKVPASISALVAPSLTSSASDFTLEPLLSFIIRQAVWYLHPVAYRLRTQKM